MRDPRRISSTAVSALAIFALAASPQTGFPHVTTPKDESGVGLEEKRGETVPLDAVFSDENGRSVTLRELVKTPTFLTPIYYSCRDVCPTFVFDISQNLGKLSSKPLEEYALITYSFDEQDTPELASRMRAAALRLTGENFPEAAWRFLTGDRRSIDELSDAIGFRFRREETGFIHPLIIAVLSREGKVVRYIYGPDILPLDLQLALLEASAGRGGPAVAKVLRFCYSYSPTGRKYVFNTLKVTGAVTLFVAVSFFLFLVLRGKRYAKRGGA
jgi:protein SCO1/2